MSAQKLSFLELQRERIPVLDGIRFFAAFAVLIAHYISMVVADQGVHNTFTTALSTFSGIGMPLFFVLSGFVIHYNYHHIKNKTGGIREYLIARFTRLYPLYILILVGEFFLCFHYGWGSCSHAGERRGLFLALPYYLTLTQDWFYGVIASNNLIYQYHLASSVAWSISLEFFFYLAYLFILPFLKKRKTIHLLLVAAIAQIFLIFCFVSCYKNETSIDKIAFAAFGQHATLQNGYQDSLLRWIYYFNPLTNLPAFFFGCVAAHLHLALKRKNYSEFELRWGGAFFTTLSLLMVGAQHFIFYLYLAPTHGFFGRTASALAAPCMAILIFCLARYPLTFWSRCCSVSFFVKLGEASYSIYLLHAFFGFHWRKYYHLGLNPWLLFIVAMGCILLISRFSFLVFERPVQKWLRNKLMGKKQPVLSQLARQALPGN